MDFRSRISFRNSFRISVRIFFRISFGICFRISFGISFRISFRISVACASRSGSYFPPQVACVARIGSFSPHRLHVCKVMWCLALAWVGLRGGSWVWPCAPGIRGLDGGGTILPTPWNIYGERSTIFSYHRF